MFEHIVSCKEEGGKEIADLGVGHGGEGIGDLFKDRITVVEDLLLLIIITDMDIGTQADVAGILPQDSVQNSGAEKSVLFWPPCCPWKISRRTG